MKTRGFAICVVLLVVALAAPAVADMIVGPVAATDGADTSQCPARGSFCGMLNARIRGEARHPWLAAAN